MKGCSDGLTGPVRFFPEVVRDGAVRGRILVLVDNEPAEGLKAKWGWSAYIETTSWKALFDADTDPRVLEHNAKVLGVKLEELDFSILSHHHGDHYGGFEYIGRVKPELKVYTPPGRTDHLRKWGLNPIPLNGPEEVGKNAWITGPIRSGFWGIREQAFSFYIDGKGLIVVVGCSHPGADKLVAKAKEVSGIEDVYMVIGGYHGPSREVLDNLARMSRYICPAHCSGGRAKAYVRRTYPDQYCEVRTGSLFML